MKKVGFSKTRQKDQIQNLEAQVVDLRALETKANTKRKTTLASKQLFWMVFSSLNFFEYLGRNFTIRGRVWQLARIRSLDQIVEEKVRMYDNF